MPHWDPTVNLGSVLSVMAFIIGLWITATKLYMRFDRRVGAFEGVLKVHADLLAAQAARTERHDSLLFNMAGNVQKVIGQLEAGNITFERLVVRFEKHEELDNERWDKHREHFEHSVNLLQASLSRMNQNIIGRLEGKAGQ